MRADLYEIDLSMEVAGAHCTAYRGANDMRELNCVVHALRAGDSPARPILVRDLAILPYTQKHYL